jgi:hypothetical protein
LTRPFAQPPVIIQLDHVYSCSSLSSLETKMLDCGSTSSLLRRHPARIRAAIDGILNLMSLPSFVLQSVSSGIG